MSRAVAQALTVSLGVPQSVDVNAVERHDTAQALTVTMGTAYIAVTINPAQSLPQG